MLNIAHTGAVASLMAATAYGAFFVSSAFMELRNASKAAAATAAAKNAGASEAKPQ